MRSSCRQRLSGRAAFSPATPRLMCAACSDALLAVGLRPRGSQACASWDEPSRRPGASYADEAKMICRIEGESSNPDRHHVGLGSTAPVRKRPLNVGISLESGPPVRCGQRKRSANSGSDRPPYSGKPAFRIPSLICSASAAWHSRNRRFATEKSGRRRSALAAMAVASFIRSNCA